MKKKAKIAIGLMLACLSLGTPSLHAQEMVMQSVETAALAEKNGVEKYAPNLEITGAYDEALAAECVNGTFVGYMQDSVLTWKGIPYAAQPVGELRFQKPEPAAASDKVYEAYHYGKACMQPTDISERASLYTQGDECLTLNIWNNVKDEGQKKPVFVFIHGGGWVAGGSADPQYNGYRFVENNPEVIVVTINYRVGMLGIMDPKPFADYDPAKNTTNIAVYDQIQALKWIHENIEAFGGDPGNVTIAGESAGGGAVANLATHDDAKGLLQKVWCMSGAANQGASMEQAKAKTESLMKSFGVTTIAELNKLPFEELKQGWERNILGSLVICRDGEGMPVEPLKAWVDGKSADYTIMTSYTKDEYAYFKQVFFEDMDFYNRYCEVTYEEIFKNADAEQLALKAQYEKCILDEGFTEKDIPEIFMHDYIFKAPERYQLEAHIANGGKGYLMSFNKPYDYPAYLGASHAVDNSYLFDEMDSPHLTGSAEEHQLALKYQRLVTNFCLTGDPSGDGVQWDEFTNENNNRLTFNDTITQGRDPEAERVSILVKLMDMNDKLKYIASTSEYGAQVEAKYPGSLERLMQFREKMLK